jgi:hypothetical protein
MLKTKKLAPVKQAYPQEAENPRDVCMVVGNFSKEPAPAAKTSGVKMRGSGAATRGFMCRGPMA